MAKQTNAVDSHGRTIEQERGKGIPAVHAYDANRVRTIGRLHLSPHRWATFEPIEQAA